MARLASYVIPRGNRHIWEALLDHDHDTSYGLHFFGPSGVGRRTFAHRYHVARNPLDAEDFNYILDPSPKTLREVMPTLHHPPKIQDRTLALKFTEEITPDQASAVISLLEEESKTRIIVISESEIPESLAGRLTEFRFSKLTDEEIADFMVISKAKYSPETVKRAVRFADGRASRAAAFREAASAQEKVKRLFQAIENKDFRAITLATSRNGKDRTWDSPSTRELQRWLNESITKKWDIFSEEDAPNMTQQEQLLLYHASTRPSGVSGKIRIAAESIARGEVHG